MIECTEPVAAATGLVGFVTSDAFRVLVTPTILAISASAATIVGLRTLNQNRIAFQETAKSNRETQEENAENSILAIERRAVKNRNIAKDEATMDFLFEKLDDDEAHKIIRRILANDYGPDPAAYLRQLASHPQTKDEKEHKTILIGLLNHYEYMAVGLKHEIYNENILRECTRTLVCRYFVSMIPFIKVMRTETSSGNVFCELAALVSKWAHDVPEGHVQTMSDTQLQEIDGFSKHTAN